MPNEKEILNTLRDIATALTAIQHTLHEINRTQKYAAGLNPDSPAPTAPE